MEAASTHDETSSSDRTKDDDDAGASDDDSDDRVDPQHHDPERLKAFNVRDTVIPKILKETLSALEIIMMQIL